MGQLTMRSSAWRRPVKPVALYIRRIDPRDWIDDAASIGGKAAPSRDEPRLCAAKNLFTINRIGGGFLRVAYLYEPSS
jgi:hypothetical protein